MVKKYNFMDAKGLLVKAIDGNMVYVPMDCNPINVVVGCGTCESDCNPDTVTVVLSGHGPAAICSVYNGIYHLVRQTIPVGIACAWTFTRFYPYPITVELKCINDNWSIETTATGPSPETRNGHINTNAPFLCDGGEVSGTAEMVTKVIGVTCSDTINATVSTP